MKDTFELVERSIYEIYLESQEKKTYIVPIYQRNYAWEENEITDLIKDIHDSFEKNDNEPYYIGTLVTYKRGDSMYEVIDGQQRLTTIYIILNALGCKDIKNKLTYGARSVSASTLKKLGDYPNLGDEADEGIKNGYKYAEKALEAIVDDKEKKVFTEYFLQEVHIIHYNVPKDVDLNHYFEVMNSRGEQLEKHEIVKSLMGQHLKNKTDLATFSRVWEACSEMNIYIQQTFQYTDVFGNSLRDFKICKFKEIPKQDETDGKETIMNLLQQSKNRMDEETETEQSDKFQPIIDFPNFLLIVLKITLMEYENFEPIDFKLDDKELLNEFNKALDFVEDEVVFVKDFALNLLKAKYFLDNYIVHHSLDDKELAGDNPWKLQYYYLETKKKRYPRNLSNKPEIQIELVHLLSMFEVSFTPKQRKNYLFYCLMFLFEDDEVRDRDYLEFLQNLAGKYFYDVYLNEEELNERHQPIPNAFDRELLDEDGELNVEYIGNVDTDYRKTFEEIYPLGRADVPLYVFNYTDYILWRFYADTLRGNRTKKGSKERNEFFENLGCSDFELDPFNNFYFSRTRKSLEHYYPQAKAGEGKPLSREEINCFGNFAMIGSEANSSGSSLDPKTKLDQYNDTKADPVSVASLKFKIMMQICKDNYKAELNGKLNRGAGLEWNFEDMKKHQEKMLDILFE